MKRSPLRRKESTGNSPGPSPAVAAFAEAFVIFALFLAVKTAVPLAAAFFGAAERSFLNMPERKITSSHGAENTAAEIMRSAVLGVIPADAALSPTASTVTAETES